jgi:hypothetical protein
MPTNSGVRLDDFEFYAVMSEDRFYWGQSRRVLMVANRRVHPLESARRAASVAGGKKVRRKSAVGSPVRWPGTVSHPDKADFERSAKSWLFDLAPARWRYEEVLHCHPIDLALMVKEYLKARALAAGEHRCRAVTRDDDRVLAQQIAEVCLRERDWAQAMLGQVVLVEEALRGEYRHSEWRYL